MGGKLSKREGRFESKKESKKRKKPRKYHRSRETLPLQTLQTSDQPPDATDHVDGSGGEWPADVRLDLATVLEPDDQVKEDASVSVLTPDNWLGGFNDGNSTLVTMGTDSSADVMLGFDPSNPDMCKDTSVVDPPSKDMDSPAEDHVDGSGGEWPAYVGLDLTTIQEPEEQVKEVASASVLTTDNLPGGFKDGNSTLATMGTDSSADVMLGFVPSNPDVCKDTLSVDPSSKDLDNPTEVHSTMDTTGTDSFADLILVLDSSNPALCMDTMSVNPASKDLENGTEGQLINIATDLNRSFDDVSQGFGNSTPGTPLETTDVLTAKSNTDALDNEVAIGSLIVIDDDVPNDIAEFPGLLAARFIRSEDEVFITHDQSSSNEEFDSDDIGQEDESIVIHQCNGDDKDEDKDEKEDEKEPQKIYNDMPDRTDNDMSEKSIDWSNVIHLTLVPRIETTNQKLLPRLVSLLRELQQKWLSSNKVLESQVKSDQNTDSYPEEESSSTSITETSSMISESKMSSSSRRVTSKNDNLVATSVTSEESNEYLGSVGGRRKDTPYDAPFPRMLSKTVVHPYSSHMRSVMSRVLTPQEEMAERQKLKEFKIWMHLKDQDQAVTGTGQTRIYGCHHAEQWDSISTLMNVPQLPVDEQPQSTQPAPTLYSASINPIMQRQPEEYHTINPMRHVPQRDNTVEVTSPMVQRRPLCWYSPYTGNVLPNELTAPLGGYVVPYAPYQPTGGNILLNPQYQSTRAHVLPNEQCTPTRGDDTTHSMSSATSDTIIESESESESDSPTDRDLPYSTTGGGVMVPQDCQHDNNTNTSSGQQSSTEDVDKSQSTSSTTLSTKESSTLSSEEPSTPSSEEPSITKEPPVHEQRRAIQYKDFSSMYLSPEDIRHVIEWLNEVDFETLKAEFARDSQSHNAQPEAIARTQPPEPQKKGQIASTESQSCVSQQVVVQPEGQAIVPLQTEVPTVQAHTPPFVSQKTKHIVYAQSFLAEQAAHAALARTHQFPLQQAVHEPQHSQPQQRAHVCPPRTELFLTQRAAEPLRQASQSKQVGRIPATQSFSSDQKSLSATSKTQCIPFMPHPPAWIPTMVTPDADIHPFTECNPPTSGTYYCMSTPVYYQAGYPLSLNKDGLPNHVSSSDNRTTPASTGHHSTPVNLPFLNQISPGSRIHPLRSTIQHVQQPHRLMKEQEKCERIKYQAGCDKFLEQRNMTGYMERKPTRVRSKGSQHTRPDNTRTARTDELTDCSYDEDSSSHRNNPTHHRRATDLQSHKTKSNAISNKSTNTTSVAPSSCHSNESIAHSIQNRRNFKESENMGYLSDQWNARNTKQGISTNTACGKVTVHYGNDTSGYPSSRGSTVHATGSHQESSGYNHHQYKRTSLDSDSDRGREQHMDSDDPKRSIPSSTLSSCSHTDADMETKPAKGLQSQSITDTDSETKMGRIRQNRTMILPHPPESTKQDKPHRQSRQWANQQSTKALSTDELRAKLRELTTYDTPRQNRPVSKSMCLKQAIDFAHARTCDKSDKGSRMRDWSHNSFKTKK